MNETRVGFRAIGTWCELLCTHPVGAAAESLARAHLATLDKACSRFRPDSEVIQLAVASTAGAGYAMPTPTFRDHLLAALHAARLTDGLVDLTVGSAVSASGYDDDLDAVRARGAVAGGVAPVPGWQSVIVGTTGLVGTPKGCVLDVGSTGKAHAADRLAAELADSLPGGFLVNLGGDIAIAGRAPAGGWRITIVDAAGAELQVVASTGQAIATSSTRHRTWTASDGVRHHIVDPRTGRTAGVRWAQVTVAAASALEANAAATAAIVLGDDAPSWLDERGFAARLDATDRTVVFAGAWPAPLDARRAA